jgi:hypothetical protein
MSSGAVLWKLLLLKRITAEIGKPSKDYKLNKQISIKSIAIKKISFSPFVGRFECSIHHFKAGIYSFISLLLIGSSLKEVALVLVKQPVLDDRNNL